MNQKEHSYQRDLTLPRLPLQVIHHSHTRHSDSLAERLVAPLLGGA
ncbi:MAG: hypothetical protein HC862_01480 [Scytonema sp. RU_4_4]|nr:hypothetical protein [Scytonema sp. RU_4_4]